MHKRLIAFITLITACLTMPAWAVTEGSSRNAPTQSQQVVSAPKGVSLGSRDEDQRYAKQEAKSPDAKKYRGGDVIVISATALVIILLVVVILILI